MTARILHFLNTHPAIAGGLVGFILSLLMSL